MIEFFGFWAAVLASFALGWVVRRGFSESAPYGDKELGLALDLAYAQGVADERAASRKRGQELAAVIDLKQQFES